MYEIVIGLEVHAQVNSLSKLFCRCDNDAFAKDPNTTVCPICMGFPGMLPTLNAGVVKKAIRAALALNCEIPPESSFDRKNYFYPDLPKGYQISQFLRPISQNGYLEVELEDDVKQIRINRLHIEDDAGKLVHEGEYTFADFNRSGSPLMEIVTEPDMRSSKEARAFAETLQQVLQYCDSSDADMYKGMMRFDASVSLRPVGDDKLYPRTEIKNLNSFKALETAIDYEVKRQTKLWEEGTPQEKASTVGWLDDEGKTQFLRAKEGEMDYRYFAEPDIPPLSFTREEIEAIRVEVPELPLSKKKRFVVEYQMNEADARNLTANQNLAEYFEQVVKTSGDSKKALSFILTILLKYINEDQKLITDCPVSAEKMSELIKIVNAGTISANAAKEVLPEMYKSGKSAEQIISEKGLKQISDVGELEKICQEVLDKNPKIVADFKGGKEQAFGALVGQVMGRTKGQANPGVVNEVLRKIIGECKA